MALIGVPGLEWSDLDPSRTPNLWKLAGQAGSASLSTRAVPPPDRGITCPMAGWLTVSAGQRSGTPGRGCPAAPKPQRNGEGASVPGWAALAAYQSETGYDAQLGTLGQVVAEGGGRVAAIGPGAALAAADKAGNITTYADTPEALPDLSSYHLIVQDVSSLADAWLRRPLDEYGVPTPMPADTRRQAAAQADRQIGTLLSRLPAGTTTLVAGISDVTPNAHLHVALATGPTATTDPTTALSPAAPSAALRLADPSAALLSADHTAAQTHNPISATDQTHSAADMAGQSHDFTGASDQTHGATGVVHQAHTSASAAEQSRGSADTYRHGHLTATSTRQDALVTITDLTATAIGALGLEPPRQVVGRVWENGGPAPATTAETVAELADADLASQVLREVRGPFFAVFVSVQLLFYAFAALALRRRRKSPGNGARSLADGTPKAQSHLPETGAVSANPAKTEPVEAKRAKTQPVQAAAETGATHAVEATPTEIPPGELTPTENPAAELTPTEILPVEAASTGVPPAEAKQGEAPTSSPTPRPNPTSPRTPSSPSSPSSPSNQRSPQNLQSPHDPKATPNLTAAGWAGSAGDVAGESRLLSVVQVVAVVSGAIAVSTFLAQLVPWWSLPMPMAGVIGTILGIAVLISGVAFGGPWRTHVLGPLTVVAAVTSVALLADVMTGSTLQVNAVTGYEPVTGGRFYGFSNIAFAVYATGTILGLAGIAHWLLGRGVPRLVTLLVCAAYGGLAVFADGWPAWGADFGGVPAFVIGLAVFLIMLAGRRVSVVKLFLVALAGAALIGAIAFFDWLRPAAQRTHLGNFVQQIIDGQALTVVGRKFGAMIGVTVGNWSLTLLSVVALAFLFLVLDRPSRWGASALGQAYALAPPLRAGLFGALTCAFIGFLINDSGIAIPAMALTMAVPLALAASVRALQLSRPTTPAQPSEQAAPTERSGA
ncbi:hypothetical protein [Nonomuraea rhodomycinica]|uniref:hypothetical protein n=1 Tax=Nonomuraea rhodomycinica TaxID=1712872 RepID=UPI001FE6A4B0|nr:hypothetical protein [Nonomuraea rhodomycinica]